jgi:hypothetical protein
VPLKWFEDTGVAQGSVALYRLVDGSWVELPTSFLNADALNAFYSAQTPGFSYFLIGEVGAGQTEVGAPEVDPNSMYVGEVGGGSTPDVEQPIGVVEDATASKSKGPLIFIMVVLVLALLFGGLYFRRKRGGKKSSSDSIGSV